MHVRKGLLRNALFAVALVTLALPATQLTSSVTPTHAQTVTQGFTQSSYAVGGGTCQARSVTTPSLATSCYVEATPGLAFNILGTNHTVTFTCGAGVGPAPAGATVNTGGALPTDLSGGPANVGAGIVPGCYNVSASVSDESGGAGATITNATCGDNAAALSGSTVNCASYASPLCPVGATTNPTAGAFCSVPDTNVPRGSQLRVTINPGAPHSYLITFTGYTPLLANCVSTGPSSIPPSGTGAAGVPPNPNTGAPFGTRGACYTAISPTTGAPTTIGPACPVGFTFVPGPFSVSTNLFVPPFEAPVTAPDGVCQFTVTAEKKYIEITTITLTPIAPCTATNGTVAAGTLLFSEGLKGFFGPACTVAVTATGVVILKTGVNCASEPNGTSAVGAGFPAGSTYSCTGDTLSVIIPGIGASTLASGPVGVTVTGSGSAGVTAGTPTPTLGTGSGAFCTAGSGAGGVLTGTGSTVTICPTGPGTGSVSASTCPPAGTGIDTQPCVNSNTLNFSFVLPNQARVVPYVRWAGEKQVLTKCFGGVGFGAVGAVSPFAGALVEFTLDGAGGNPAQASLIPASLGGTVGSTGGVEPVAPPAQNTVITAADADGCATVILFASGEGAVTVDASIYAESPTASGAVPLVNEHAFEVFYLKYDHISLEDLSQSNPQAFPTYNTATIVPTAITNLGFSATAASFTLPAPPGVVQPGANGYSIPLCGNDYLRALVHGYFELPGDPSGRPATTVSIPGAPNGAVGSYVLPAGRWVLPEDWPVLATFAGFNAAGAPNDTTPSSVFAWDLNSGWVFNPGGENIVVCAGPTVPPSPQGVVSAAGTANQGVTASGAIDNTNGGTGVSYGPCFSKDAAGTQYESAPGPATGNCASGVTVGIGPFDITQACTTPGPLTYAPEGSFGLSPAAGGNFNFSLISTNSTYLPNGTLNQWDAPMPPAQVSFGITAGPGFLNQVNKTGFYAIPTFNTAVSPAVVNGAIYPDPFYAEAIPASPLIPPVANNGGYLWDTFGFRGGTTLGTTTGPGFIAGFSTTATFPTVASTATGFTSFGSCAEQTVGPTPTNGGFPGPNATAGQGFAYYPQNSPAVEGLTGAAVAAAGCYVSSFPSAAGPATPPATTGAPATVSVLSCNALHGHFIQTIAAGTGGSAVAFGLCWTEPAPATAPGGINLTNFGDGCPPVAGGAAVPSSGTQVEVANTAGFFVGETVNIVANGNGTVPAGTTIVAGLTITAITPGPDVLNPTATAPPPAAGEADNTTGAPGTLTFATTTTAPGGTGTPSAFTGCVAIYQATVVGTDIAIPVPSSAAGLGTLTPGAEVDLVTPGGTFTGIISAGGCAVPAAGTPATPTLPAGSTSICITGGTAFLTSAGGIPAGTLIILAPSVGTVPLHNASPLFPTGIPGAPNTTSSVGQGPYPFWQWVPNPAPNLGTFPRSATVYSDNHGEAVVSLETGVMPQVLPSATGACPANYTAVVIGGVTVNCELNFAALGTTTATPGGTAFQGITQATGTFNAASAGCGVLNPATNAFAAATPTAVPTGTATATATATPSNVPAPAGSAVVPGSGPGAGQICINNLGGIEFGSGAVLGTTTVQAIADYPYFRGLHPAISSGAVNKIFTSGFNKSVTVSPTPGGIAGPSGTTAYTVTITGTDICGNPILGEPVNVFALANAGAVVLAPFGPGSSNGTNAATVYLSTGAGQFTGITQGTATLSLEVLSSVLGNGGLVLKVVFPLERVERFVTVIPGTTGPTTTTVLYPPGYSQVGGPAGTSFGNAEAVFAYNAASNTYTPVNATNVSSAAPTCQGYWAYFASAASVTLNVTSSSGQTVTCNLAAGWNLVGNPFASNALLPAGTSGYHWNGTAYDTVTAIPVGGAVWIYETAATSVTLTAT